MKARGIVASPTVRHIATMQTVAKVSVQMTRFVAAASGMNSALQPHSHFVHSAATRVAPGNAAVGRVSASAMRSASTLATAVRMCATSAATLAAMTVATAVAAALPGTAGATHRASSMATAALMSASGATSGIAIDSPRHRPP